MTTCRSALAGVKYTIKDGIIYDAKELLGDVRKHCLMPKRMVE